MKTKVEPIETLEYRIYGRTVTEVRKAGSGFTTTGDEKIVHAVKLKVQRAGCSWYRVGGPREIKFTIRKAMKVTRIAMQAPRLTRMLKPEVAIPFSPFMTSFEPGSTVTIIIVEKVAEFVDRGESR